MQKLENFVNLIKDIDVLREKIIRSSVSFSKKIRTQKGDFINFIMTNNKDLSEEEAKNIFTSAISSMTSDALSLSEELPLFIDMILNNKTFEDYKIEFLEEVWLGDLYGTTGLESLVSLKEDLKSQLKNFTIEHFKEKLLMD